MIKKLIKPLLVVLMLAAWSQASAFTVNGINYSVSSGVATVTGATSKDITTVTIPATVTYNGTTYPVNFISHSAFNNYKSLREVIIEESDTYIGSPVYIGSMGTSTNTSPFVGCPIESYWLGRDICKKTGSSIATDIMRLASTASSVSLTFTGGTTYVMNLPFFHSTVAENLTSVALGGNIQEVYREAFSKCNKLSTLTLLPGNVLELSNSWFPEGIVFDTLNLEGIQYTSLNGLNFKNVVFGDTWTKVPEMMLSNYQKLETVTLGSNIEKINDRAFFTCESLVTVNYPSSLKVIGTAAFFSCPRLSTPQFNEGLETIEGSAYSECKGITELYFPGTLKKIGGYAFHAASNVNKIVIAPSADNSVLALGGSALGVGDMDSLIVNRVVESEYLPTFSDCRPKHVVLGDVWTEVPEKMFMNNSQLETVTLGVNIETIGSDAFILCESLEAITYPSSLKVIGARAFYNCTSLSTPQFNEGLEMIGGSAFSECKGFTELFLPGTLKRIGEYAFSGADNVNKIVIAPSDDNSVLPLGGSALGVGEVDSLIVNRVVESDNFPTFSDCHPKHVVLGDSWKELTYRMFLNNSKLETITLGANIEKIYEEAFSACTSISEVRSNAKVPPVCAFESVFASEIYPTASLVVPLGSKRAYSSAEVWKNFLNISTEGSLLVTVDYDPSRGNVKLNGAETDSLTVDEGEPLDVAVTAAKGFYLKGMTANGDNCLDKVVNGVLHYDEISDSLHIVVDFAELMLPVTVNTSSTGGHVELNGTGELPAEIQYGSRVVVKAIPDEGYVLKSLTVNGESVECDATGEYVIESLETELVIEAIFEIIRYKAVAVYNHDMGKVLLNGTADETEVDFNGQLKIEAVAAEGHYVGAITVNEQPVVATAEPVVIENVRADQTVEVTFDIYKYLVEAVYDQAMGSVTVNGLEGSAEVAWGSDAVVDIVPAYGYQIASVMLDDEDVTEAVSAEGQLTIPAVKAARKLVVAFEIKRVRLSVAGIEGGVLTTIHDFGTEVRYLPEAEEGWEFHSATVGDTVIDSLDEDGCFGTGPLTENTTVTVVFKKTDEGGVNSASASAPVKVTAKGRTITISGAPDEVPAAVFDDSGLRYYYGYERSITLDKVGVYIVVIANQSFKVLLR